MARRKIALKGQSRSLTCPVKARGMAACGRLEGHKGKHRPTLFRRNRDQFGGLSTDQAVEAMETAEAVAKKVVAKRRVRRIPAAKVRRVVAAPQRRARRKGARPSGVPTLARPSVG